MDKNLLVKLFGFSALLIHCDTLVLDRWNWLKRRLPRASNACRLLDVGCGNGVFSIGLSLKGYNCLGLSWDEQDQAKSNQRAKICQADSVKFDICDVRFLETRQDLVGNFDVVISLENIEHIFDDQKLMNNMVDCLKPNGRLLLTTPNHDYVPISGGYKGKEAVSKTEDGGHVRIGYGQEGLRTLCERASLEIDEISYCSGFLSQKISALLVLLSKVNRIFGLLCVLPLRVIPPLLDKYITRLLGWEHYSICVVAHKKSA